MGYEDDGDEYDCGLFDSLEQDDEFVRRLYIPEQEPEPEEDIIEQEQPSTPLVYGQQNRKSSSKKHVKRIARSLF